MSNFIEVSPISFYIIWVCTSLLFAINHNHNSKTRKDDKIPLFVNFVPVINFTIILFVIIVKISNIFTVFWEKIKEWNIINRIKMFGKKVKNFYYNTYE